jgi:glycosyltransferase involved in cell wall biosynthesis
MARRVRLALVTETTIGGVRKHIGLILKHINHEDFEVTVIAPSRRLNYEGESDFVDEVKEEGIPYRHVPMVRNPSLVSDTRCYLMLRKLLTTERFDAVHAHGAKAGFLVRMACHSHTSPRCYYSPHVFAFQRSGSGKAALYLRAERFASRWRSTFIVGSEAEKEATLQANLASTDGIVIIRNAVELTNHPVSRDLIREQLGTKVGAAVFITMGRLVEYKGQRNVINAFAIAAKDLENSELWVVGEGEDLSNLQKISVERGIQNRVRFLGYRKDVLDLLAASDCFVLASEIEGSPYSVLEAFALEKPVICTDVAGTREMISHASRARRVSGNDVAALASAMTEFCHSRFSGTPLSELPSEWFDVPRQIRKLEQTYLG